MAPVHGPPRFERRHSSQNCHVSHDTTNAGFDPLAAPPRDGDGVVKWPILARLPWVGEPVEEVEAAAPVDFLPFAESASEPYVPPTFHAIEAELPQLRVVDGASPLRVESAPLEPNDRRLHRMAANRPVVEPPHLNVHRFPAAGGDEVATEPRPSPSASAAASRQQRRFDPPQPHFNEGIALHRPSESLAAQLYQWHTKRQPQTGLIAVALLVLAAGGVYLLAIGRPADGPRAVAEPPAWEIQPIPSPGGVNDSLAAPLPVSPPLDLSPGGDLSASPEAKAVDSPPPANNSADAAEADDPIANWLNRQPTLPQFTASRSAAEQPASPSRSVETTVENPVTPPDSPLKSSPTAPSLPDRSITPTPSLTLSAPYTTTPYAPFPSSLTLSPPNASIPGIADAPASAFGPPPQPTR
jgi:hypothetical protein